MISFTGIQSALKLYNLSASMREQLGWLTLKVIFEQKEQLTVMSTQCGLFF